VQKKFEKLIQQSSKAPYR